MPPNNEPLIYRQEGELTFIEINRPEMKNALNFECWQLLAKYCDQLVAENQIRVLVITGHTNFFSTLLDLIQKADSKKILRDTGKLLGVDQRNWIKTSFLGDFQRLVSRNLKNQI
jgi:enoyl-CoA hydratase/carnithine racemase